MYLIPVYVLWDYDNCLNICTGRRSEWVWPVRYYKVVLVCIPLYKLILPRSKLLKIIIVV